MFGGDTSGIGFQLSMYRMLDSFEKAREIREAANERSVSDFYIGQYNALARRFNGLSNALRELAPQVGDMERRVQAQDQELRAKDARIAELEAQLQPSRGAEVSPKGEVSLRQVFLERGRAAFEELEEEHRRKEQLRSQQP